MARHEPEDQQVLPPLGWMLRVGAVLGALMLFLWFRVDVSLLYYSHWTAPLLPPFRAGREFASGVLPMPGGPAEYCSGFLCLLYCVPALGAASVALLAGMLAFGSAAIVKRISGRWPRFVHFLPVLCLAVAYARYSNPMAVAVAAVLAVAAAAVYALVPARTVWAGVAAFALLGAAASYCASGVALLFVGLCVLCEAARRRYRLAAVCLAAGAALPALAAWALRTPLGMAYAEFPSWSARLRPTVRLLPYTVPLAVLVACALALWRRTDIEPPEAAAAPSLSPKSGPAGVGRWALATALVLLVVAGAPSLLAHRRAEKARLAIDVFAQYGAWEQVLAEADRLGLDDFSRMVLLDVNRALYHLGLLPDTMFAYPQSSTTLMQQYYDLRVTPSESEPVAPPIAYAKCADLMMDLGRVSEAEVAGVEAWEVLGDRPELLARLSAINAAKGRPEAASAFRRALDEAPVCSGFLGRLLAHRRWTARLPEDEEIARTREMMVTANTCYRFSDDALLRQLLVANPANRMAFEYLLAYHLLSGEVEQVATVLGHLKDFGYTAIPRHCEEALLLLAEVSGKSVVIPGYSISAESLRRFADFRKVREACPGNLAAARPVMVERFAGSYLLYYTFPDAGGGLR